MAESGDPRIRELKLLRSRTGLRAGRTVQCETLLAELGIDSAELHRRIVAELRDMGEGRDARALRWAYGFDLKDPGVSLEQRRRAFASEFDNQATDTVEVWENRAIEELLLRLMAKTDTPLQPVIAVSAYVGAGRIRTTYYSVNEQVTSLRNDSEQASLPFLIYQLPDDQSVPADLILLARFAGARPKSVYRVEGANLIALATTSERFELEAKNTSKDDMPLYEYVWRWGGPTKGVYYGLIWEY